MPHVSKGVDINVTTTELETPLMVACEHNHSAFVYHMIMRGAELNARDSDGNTALNRCAPQRGAHHTAMLLLLGGANHTLRNLKFQVSYLSTAHSSDVCVTCCC